MERAPTDKDGVETKPEIPIVASCRTDKIAKPFTRWRRKNPGIQTGWYVLQALWDRLKRDGHVTDRDERPS